MLELLDYRRRVHDLYRAVRAQGTENAHQLFRRERDTLFATHPQSALDAAQKASFTGLNYYAYDPAFRVVAALDRRVTHVTYNYDLEGDGYMTIEEFAQVNFSLPTGSGTLGVFWITGYGGGLFLPFRDTTNKSTTYGGGRYLYDTIKGADLGTEGDRIVLDFNYAYHPSCYYNPRWVCPLAPPQNHLSFAIEAGEKLMQPPETESP